MSTKKKKVAIPEIISIASRIAEGKTYLVFSKWYNHNWEFYGAYETLKDAVASTTIVMGEQEEPPLMKIIHVKDFIVSDSYAFPTEIKEYCLQPGDGFYTVEYFYSES